MVCRNEAPAPGAKHRGFNPRAGEGGNRDVRAVDAWRMGARQQLGWMGRSPCGFLTKGAGFATLRQHWPGRHPSSGRVTRSIAGRVAVPGIRQLVELAHVLEHVVEWHGIGEFAANRLMMLGLRGSSRTSSAAVPVVTRTRHRASRATGRTPRAGTSWSTCRSLSCRAPGWRRVT